VEGKAGAATAEGGSTKHHRAKQDSIGAKTDAQTTHGGSVMSPGVSDPPHPQQTSSDAPAATDSVSGRQWRVSQVEM